MPLEMWLNILLEAFGEILIQQIGPRLLMFPDTSERSLKDVPSVHRSSHLGMVDIFQCTAASNVKNCGDSTCLSILKFLIAE